MSQARSTAGSSRPSSAIRVQNTAWGLPGLLPPLLPGPGDQRLDRGRLLGDGEQGARALHDLAAHRRAGRDPLGGGGGGQRRLHPVAAQHVDGLRVTDDGHVDDALEQRRLGAKAHIDGARPDPGALGNGFQGRGHVAVRQEQLGGGGDDPLLGLRDLRLPQRRQLAPGIDFVSHTMQYNCNNCIMTAIGGTMNATDPPVLAGIHHLKLPVTDLARSREWYESRLGYRVHMEFVEEGQLMGVGMAHPNGGPPLALRMNPERARAAAGFDYFSIGVPDKDAIDQLAARLTALGERHAGVHWASIGWILPELHDPDGHEIRFYTHQHHTEPDPQTVTTIHDPRETSERRERAAT